MNEAQIITLVLYILTFIVVVSIIDDTRIYDVWDFFGLIYGGLLMAAWTSPFLYLPIFVLLGNL